jgi:acyl-CoA synthetase (AMP-forming)/AMP-acid ligase II
VAAASADIGVAEGDRYPRLSLLGSVAPLALKTSGFSGNLLTWSIGPSVSLPIFDAGRRAANVQSAKAAYVAAEADYRSRARQAVREVEEALLLHPALHEVSVIGRRHADWGEEVVAFIVLRPGQSVSDAELDQVVIDNIARFKRPKQYIRVDSLPKSNYGKILKTELRELLARG